MNKGNPRKRATKRVAKPSAGTQRTPALATANVVDIVDRYQHAVVNIEVVKHEKKATKRRESWAHFHEVDESEPVKNTTNIGTGFFYDPRGYILTNEHVLHGADEVYVRLYNARDREPAKVIWSSYELDLAVLQVKPPKNMAVLPLGETDRVRVGEWVVAIGCPLGLDHSVTVGIVSATERYLAIGDRRYERLLQTDAAINRGNSGGPLINMRGQVIGVNTAVSASSQGIGFAIPIDIVKEAVKGLTSNIPAKRKVTRKK